LKIAAGSIAAKLLKSQRMIKEFRENDRTISEIMIKKGEIAEMPPELESYHFEVDKILEEGDRLELGSGIVWTAYHTPGHSPCHMSLYEEKEGTLAIGDATGFYVPEKGAFWPNYFDSLETYCNSIRKLSALHARRGALSHNTVVDGWLKEYFQKAIKATESYHLEMVERVGKGEDPEKIALEKAEWVNSLTDIQTFEVMYNLAKLMLARSQSEAGKKKLFTI
jgi:glyoxylase-like metal-dependent hydrolase (beta-lactamase superfamily II)